VWFYLFPKKQQQQQPQSLEERAVALAAAATCFETTLEFESTRTNLDADIYVRNGYMSLAIKVPEDAQLGSVVCVRSLKVAGQAVQELPDPVQVKRLTMPHMFNTYSLPALG
jgi:hypothetical protein